MDLCAADAPRNLSDQLTAQGRTVEVLINNAGYALFGEFIQTDPDRCRAMLELDVVALTQLTRAFAADMAAQLNSPRLRIYSSADLVGVELGGAVKNVIAIAAGICDGLSLGRNARAALITRGLAEMTRLGVALGARPATFAGLAGLGDLVLTCTGDLSRNRRVGLLLAEGRALPDIVRELGHVAEGVPAAREVARRATELGIEMPITRAVSAVLDGRITPRAAVEQLMARDPKHE